MSMPDLAARLSIVVTRLKDAGIVAAADPADVDVPGVWVDLTGVIRYTSRGSFVGCEVVVLVPAVEGRLDQYKALQELLDDVVAELGIPDGDVRKQATVLPEGPVAYPSLVLPYMIGD